MTQEAKNITYISTYSNTLEVRWEKVTCATAYKVEVSRLCNCCECYISCFRDDRHRENSLTINTENTNVKYRLTVVPIVRGTEKEETVFEIIRKEPSESEKDSIKYLNESLKQYYAVSALIIGASIALLPQLLKGEVAPDLLFWFLGIAFLGITTFSAIYSQNIIVNLTSQNNYNIRDRSLVSFNWIAIVAFFLGIAFFVVFIIINRDNVFGTKKESTPINILIYESSSEKKPGAGIIEFEIDPKTGKLKEAIINR